MTVTVGSSPVPSVPAEGERDQREEGRGPPAEPHQVFPRPVQVGVAPGGGASNTTAILQSERLEVSVRLKVTTEPFRTKFLCSSQF